MEGSTDFTDTFQKCDISGVGHSFSCRYQRSAHSSNKTLESVKCDRYTQVEKDNVQMFGIYSGFNDDGHIADFVMNSMLFEMLSLNPPISEGPSNPPAVINDLRRRYATVVQRYKQEMQGNLNLSMFRHSKQYRITQKESDLEKKCKGGCTALIVLRKEDDLYVLNCGTSLAVVITEYNSKALCSIHNNHNEAEVARLKQCGVAPLLVNGPTRAIGDPTRNSQYQDNPNFRTAVSAPVISDPELQHYKIQPTWNTLILVSGGVCNNLRKAGVEDIPAEVAEGFHEETTPTSSAQALVDYFNRKYMTAHEKFDHRFNGSELDHQEEMTAIYVRLNKPNIMVDINTIGSTTGTTSYSVPMEKYSAPVKSYLDLDETRIPVNIRGVLEKFLLKE